VNVVPATGELVISVYGPPDVAERYTLYPTTFDVLAVHESETEWDTGCVPVPESEMLIGELVALLVTVTLPENVAAEPGAN